MSRIDLLFKLPPDRRPWRPQLPRRVKVLRATVWLALAGAFAVVFGPGQPGSILDQGPNGSESEPKTGLGADNLTGQPFVPPAQDYVLHFRPFGGMNGVAYTPQISLGTSFTMESWVFLDAASPFSVIMGKANNPRSADPYMHYIIGFERNGRAPSFVQSTGQPGTHRSITGTSELPLSTWTHLAAVLDSGVMRLYVNGQLVASGASPGPPGGAAVPFGLGAGIPDGTSVCCAFWGAMREVRVWSRALSSPELRTYATQKLKGTEAGLISNWPLSEGSGPSIRGIGSQPATLTIQGPANWNKPQLLDGGAYCEVRDPPGQDQTQTLRAKPLEFSFSGRVVLRGNVSGTNPESRDRGQLDIDGPPTTTGESGVKMAVTKSISICNNAGAPARIRPTKVEDNQFNAFSVVEDSCSRQTINPGGSCRISIRFTPEKPGGYSTKLFVVTDATDAKPLEIPVKGKFVIDDQASPR